VGAATTGLLDPMRHLISAGLAAQLRLERAPG